MGGENITETVLESAHQLIREGRTYEIDSVIETSLQQGMVSLNKSLVELVRAGEISIENARKYSLNTNALEKMI